MVVWGRLIREARRVGSLETSAHTLHDCQANWCAHLPLQVRFLLMQNALPTHLRLHRRYDLKGSRYGRTAGASRETKPFVTLKDLDVDAKASEG